MAIGRRKSSSETVSQEASKDRPGKRGMSIAMPPKQAKNSPPLTQRFRMILDHSSVASLPQQDVTGEETTSIAPNVDHPLASLSPQNRLQERLNTIASVLARLANDAGLGQTKVIR